MTKTDDYRERVKAAILDERFVRASFSGMRSGHAAQEMPWNRVTLRPVEIGGKRQLQVIAYDERRCITKNYNTAEASAALDELMALPFKNLSVETSTMSLQVQFTKRDKLLVHEHAAKPEASTATPDLAHDRKKRRPLPDDTHDPFLQAVGIMTQVGTIRADRQRKYRQINEFLTALEQALHQVDLTTATPETPFTVVDCGCGSAHLTFAAYHYLRDLREIPTRVVGIDVNQALIGADEATARELGWDQVRFEATPIAEYSPPEISGPKMVLALHACDTATDDALALAIRWQSDLILCVPCCQHHLQRQLSRQGTTASLGPLLRHGLLRERLGDVATDAFRALILRLMGYRTDVMEFISTEHTAKNVMIRAVRSAAPGDPDLAHEYRELKDLLRVTPYLEDLLGNEIANLRA